MVRIYLYIYVYIYIYIHSKLCSILEYFHYKKNAGKVNILPTFEMEPRMHHIQMQKVNFQATSILGLTLSVRVCASIHIYMSMPMYPTVTEVCR